MSIDYRNIIKNVDESEYEFVTYYKDYIVVKTAGSWKEHLEKMPEYSTSCTPADRLYHLKELTEQLTNVDKEQEHRRLLALIRLNRFLSGKVTPASEIHKDSGITLDDVYAICRAVIDETDKPPHMTSTNENGETAVSELLEDVSKLFELNAVTNDEKTAPNYLLVMVRALLLNFLAATGETSIPVESSENRFYLSLIAIHLELRRANK